MKIQLLFAAVLVTGISSSQAAEVAEPYRDWTGFYSGINAGRSWSESYSLPDPDVALTGGGLLGYNWQHDRFVVGVETDFNYLSFGDDFSLDNEIFGSEFDEGVSIDTNWFGTLRGRVGIAAGNVLFYGTAGLAYGQMNVDWNLEILEEQELEEVSLGSWNSSTTGVNWGYTVGAGVEYGIEQWSIGAEYLFVDLGDFDWEGDYAVDVDDDTQLEGSIEGMIDFKFTLLRATAKYRF